MAKNNNVGLSEYIGAIIIVAAVAIIVENLNWSQLITAVVFLGILGYIFRRRRK